MGKPTLYVVERKEIFVLSTIFVFVAIFSFVLGMKYGQRMEQEKIMQAKEEKSSGEKAKQAENNSDNK